MQYGEVQGVDKPVSRLVQGTVMIGFDKTERSFELLDEVREPYIRQSKQGGLRARARSGISPLKSPLASHGRGWVCDASETWKYRWKQEIWEGRDEVS